MMTDEELDHFGDAYWACGLAAAGVRFDDFLPGDCRFVDLPRTDQVRRWAERWSVQVSVLAAGVGAPMEGREEDRRAGIAEHERFAAWCRRRQARRGLAHGEALGKGDRLMAGGLGVR